VGELPAGAALSGLHPVERPREMGDVLVSEAQQVLGGHLATRDLVDPGRHRLTARDPLREDHGDGQLEGQGALERGAVRHRDDDRLDRLIEQPVYGAAKGLGAEVADPHQRHVVPGVVAGVLDRNRDHAGPVEGQVGRDHPDPAGPVGGQEPGGVVAAVPELGDRREHPCPGGLLDQLRAVEHPRNRLVRDSGGRGHVGHARPAPSRALAAAVRHGRHRRSARPARAAAATRLAVGGRPRARVLRQAGRRGRRTPGRGTLFPTPELS
jgi:hypothetical protein